MKKMLPRDNLHIWSKLHLYLTVCSETLLMLDTSLTEFIVRTDQSVVKYANRVAKKFLLMPKFLVKKYHIDLN